MKDFHPKRCINVPGAIVRRDTAASGGVLPHETLAIDTRRILRRCQMGFAAHGRAMPLLPEEKYIRDTLEEG